MNTKIQKYMTWSRNRSFNRELIFSESNDDVINALNEALSNRMGISAFGNGKSYNDCSISIDNKMIRVNHNDFIEWENEDIGVVRCGATATLRDLEEFLSKTNWSIPVVPGIIDIACAGAIANDIHGKNHSSKGTIGCHIRQICIARSDSGISICSMSDNQGLFKATIGGVGLTGVILWADIQLSERQSDTMECVDVAFDSIDEYFRLTDGHQFEYEASWLDLVAHNKGCRGIIKFGSHITPNVTQPVSKKEKSKQKKCISFLGISLVNKISIWLFNTVYFELSKRNKKKYHLDTGKYLYPLDKVSGWNLLYGKRGFFQYQCVIPHSERDRISEIFDIVVQSIHKPSLSVIKKFGKIVSPGLLSFPEYGYAIAMDFPYRKGIVSFFDDLNKTVKSCNGKIYLAKNIVWPGCGAADFFKNIDEFQCFIDPAIRSTLSDVLLE